MIHFCFKHCGDSQTGQHPQVALTILMLVIYIQTDERLNSHNLYIDSNLHFTFYFDSKVHKPLQGEIILTYHTIHNKVEHLSSGVLWPNGVPALEISGVCV